MNTSKFETEAERAAYQEGVKFGENEALQYPGSYVVVFDDSLTYEDKKSIGALLSKCVRGVVGVYPMEETHHSFIEWCELVEALSVDACDDHAHNAALNVARSVKRDLEWSTFLFSMFLKEATEEQRQRITLASIAEGVAPRLSSMGINVEAIRDEL